MKIVNNINDAILKLLLQFGYIIIMVNLVLHYIVIHNSMVGSVCRWSQSYLIVLKVEFDIGTFEKA